MEVEDANGCKNWDTLTAYTKPKPTITVEGDKICYGTTPTIKATGNVDEINWPDGSKSTRPTNKPTGDWEGSWQSSTTLTGGRIFTVSASKDNCLSDIKNAIVSVLPKQELSFAVDGENTQGRPVMVCKGKTTNITITNTNLSDITWSGRSETEANISQSITEDTEFSASANVTVDNKSCPAEGKQTVKVFPTSKINIKGGGAVCLGEEMSFTASGSDSYHWHISKASAGTIISNSSDSSEITVRNITEAFTIYATGTDVNGCVSERSVDSAVTILPSPTITISDHADTICSGSELRMTVSTNNGDVSWILGHGAVGTEVNTTLTTQYGSLRKEVYRAKATFEGCTSEKEAVINILPLPELTLTTDGAFCSGDSVLIRAKESYGSAVEYAWNGSTSYSSQDTFVARQGGNYQVTARMKKKGIQCMSMEPLSTTITEVALPTISNIEVTGKPCQGERVSLRPIGSNSTSFDWYYITKDQKITHIESMESIQPVITQDTTFRVEASNTQTFASVTLVCKGSKDTTLSLLPDPTFNLKAETPCFGENMTIEAQGTGYEYEWTWDGNQNESGKDFVTINNATGSHIFHVTATSAEGCNSSKDTTVNVNALPIINGFSGENIICVDNRNSVISVLCDNPSSIKKYEWTAQSSNGFRYDATDSSKITILPSTAQEDVVYTVTVTDNNGCFSSKNYEIDIKPMPETDAQVLTQCPTEPTNITVKDKNGMDNVSYAWYEYDSSKEDHKGEFIGTGDKLEKEISQETQFVVTANSEFGCETDTTVTATIHPMPTISFSGETTICEGEPTTLRISSTGVLGNVSYFWQEIDATKSMEEVTVSPKDTTIYHIAIETSNNCKMDTFIQINVKRKPIVTINDMIDGNDKICEGEPYTMTAKVTNMDGTFNYVWKDYDEATITSGGNYAIENSEKVLKLAQVDNLERTYKVIVTEEDGSNKQCSDETRFTLTPLLKPAVSITNVDSVCEGMEADIEVANAQNHLEYVWDNGKTGSKITERIEANSTNEFKVTCVDPSNGCQSRDSITVETKPYPSIVLYDSTGTPLASKDITVCKDSTIKVIAGTSNANGAAVAYGWNKENDLNFSQSGATIQATISDAYNYIVTAVMRGCESKDTIHTGYFPTPTVTVDGNKNTCPGGNVTLNVSVTGGSASSTYTTRWESEENVDIESSTGNTAVAKNLESGRYTFYAFATDNVNYCNAKSEPFIVEVWNKPTIIVTPDQTSVCKGESTNITAKLQSGNGSFT